MQLVEPLRELFRTKSGRSDELGLDDAFVVRQPFPGPGLAVRILGEVTRPRLDLLRRPMPSLPTRSRGGMVRASGSFAVLLPIQSVGVMGDERTYENAVAIRAVEPRDGMTADWARLPHDVLARISCEDRQRVRGINRVVYDISSNALHDQWE